MEDSALKPCQNPPVTLPPHSSRFRRRPIQSETYRTLLTILSHCDALQTFSPPQIPVSLQDYNVADKLGEEAVNNASVNHSGVELEMPLVQQKSPFSESEERHGFQDGGDDTLNEVDRLDPTDITVQGKDIVTQNDSGNLVDSSTVNNQACEVPDEKNACCLTNSHQELSPRRELKVLHEPFNEVPQNVSSSVDIDGDVDMPIPVASNIELIPAMDEHFSNELEHELQLKQKELENLVSTSGDLDLPHGGIEDGEIEEGEISGESNQEMDLVFEDAASREEKKLDELQTSEHNAREALAHVNGDARLRNCDIRPSQFLDAVDCSNDIMELETESTRKEQYTRDFGHGKETATDTPDGYDTCMKTGWAAEHVSRVNKTDHPAISLENLAQHGLIHEDTTENKSSVDAKMEASDGKRKRKKGHLTKERREKKKKKERIKRAEKNRALGVKRLKLQPLVKPKTVAYCRHYLNSRCQEGEKCKFSHDTTPLTKPKACTFFARRGCMKGDKCPFDHQLSKYPCNNFVTTGFCCRGAFCLFSHEVANKHGSLPTSNVTKPECNSPSMISGSISKKQVNNQGVPHQHVDTKFSAAVNFFGKNTEKKVSEHPDRPAAKMPKGICLISHVRSPPGNTSKHEQIVPHLKGGDSEKLSYSMTGSLPGNIQKSNDLAKGVPPKMPTGINFLSFGKRLMDESLNRDNGVGGSKSKSVDSPLKSEGGTRIEDQAGQSSSDLEPKVNKIADRVSPLSAPGAMKFLSIGKVPVDNVTAVSQQDNVNMGSPLFHEKEKASSSHSFKQSFDQSGSGNYGGMSSLSKTSVLLNTPSSVQKALQSTLSFAAKLDAGIKLNLNKT